MSAHRTRCRDIGALLPAYLEQELRGDDASRVRGHLELCAVCRADARRMERALGALRSLEPVPMPDAVGVGLHAKIAALAMPRRNLTQRLRLAGAAAAVMLAVVSTAYVGSRYAASPKETQTVVARPPVPPSADAETSGPPADLTAPAVRVASRAETPALPPVAAVRTLNEPAAARSEVRRDTGMPASFLDVTDRRGVSARMLLAAQGRMANGSGAGDRLPSPVLPPALRDRTDSAWSDHVRIGETVTELRGMAERDGAGRIRSMRIAAETLGAGAEQPEREAEATVTLDASESSDLGNRPTDMER